ncbi:MAG: Rap1a/Tai family immunity protein [Sphingomonadaceae bacterium]
MPSFIRRFLKVASLLSLTLAGQSLPLSAQPVLVSDQGFFTFGAECSAEDKLEATYCVGYILGTSDQLSIHRDVCRKQSSGGNVQTLAVVRKYLKDHPENWDRHPLWLVKQSLTEAFPCSATAKGN